MPLISLFQNRVLHGLILPVMSQMSRPRFVGHVVAKAHDGLFGWLYGVLCEGVGCASGIQMPCAAPLFPALFSRYLSTCCPGDHVDVFISDLGERGGGIVGL